MAREIKLFNTLTGKKEVFVPVVPAEARIYVCGVTPYNHPHIGNARPFVVWDAIRRFLARAGYKVRYIQNFTDIDDKIIRAANEEGATWKEIADKYIAAYFAEIDALNVRRADVYPRVSDHIPEIIAMIERLVEKGHAYPLDGDVYYRVESFADYGKLSGRRLDDMMAGARVEVDERKENPLDFALWKGAKPGEPSWPSPWGEGRPGWHIECSVMSLKYLGQTFDIHGGGSDLIFPHHENEIAQSCAYLGDEGDFAHYWVHNGFITINQEKMSKSLNNFFTVNDILKDFAGETVRFFILGTHYRSPLDFSESQLKDAEAALGRLANTKSYIDELTKRDAGAVSHSVEEVFGGESTAADLAHKAAELKEKFYQAMADDFNTALAISYLFELAKDINIYYNSVANKNTPFDAAGFAAASGVFTEFCDIIGILEQAAPAAKDDGEAAEIDKLVAERNAARKAKDWKRADAIRDELKARGITIEDSASGTRWKKVS